MTAPTILVRGRRYVLDDRIHDWRQRSPGDKGPTGTFICLTCGAETPKLPGPPKCRPQLVPLDWLAASTPATTRPTQPPARRDETAT